MDFSYSEKTEQLRAQLNNFMDDHIVPRIRPRSEEVNADGPDEGHLQTIAPLEMRDLKDKMVDAANYLAVTER